MEKEISHPDEARPSEDVPQSSLSDDFVLSSRESRTPCDTQTSATATTILTKAEIDWLYDHCDEYYIDGNEKAESNHRHSLSECAATTNSTDLDKSCQDNSAVAREKARRASTESLKAAGRKLRKISREFHFKFNQDATDET
ncbi:uncharacterized protein LOC111085681 [Limulus polyphemus]|uniref:Uncharacterized protein LOC111085681 n=1 Tax=Limulus polyphemus TaxID=6850 RepID=A0ABM1SBW8_LIMPO|nr:uncharacterized protein LOC111085681 [Limulus polyphemus]XP_022241123.1 uncharacterized protein LOC111085681 [Limulus polyphemus]